MRSVVDTSVLIDVLRGSDAASRVLLAAREGGRLHASEVTRLEVLAGMRPSERIDTESLFEAFVWHPLDAQIAVRAGALGRAWLPSHHTIDGPDLAIAATAQSLEARLLTRNVRHFPMFPGLAAPY